MFDLTLAEKYRIEDEAVSLVSRMPMGVRLDLSSFLNNDRTFLIAAEALCRAPFDPRTKPFDPQPETEK